LLSSADIHGHCTSIVCSLALHWHFHGPIVTGSAVLCFKSFLEQLRTRFRPGAERWILEDANQKVTKLEVLFRNHADVAVCSIMLLSGASIELAVDNAHRDQSSILLWLALSRRSSRSEMDVHSTVSGSFGRVVGIQASRQAQNLDKCLPSL
jgi:hypothetical protein